MLEQCSELMNICVQSELRAVGDLLLNSVTKLNNVQGDEYGFN